MQEKQPDAIEAFEELLHVLKRLRGEKGCPWDRKQTEKTMAPRILEEAYEVLDAIEEGEANKVAEELGDLSMNLLLTCLIAEEKGDFRVEEVFRRISSKLIHRHPHVFGNEGPMDEDRFLNLWEDIKRNERRIKNEDTSAIAGIPLTMPSLFRALRLAEKLKRTGADLPFLNKTAEQARTIMEELFPKCDDPPMDSTLKDKVGELLMAQVVSCLKLKINPEMALRSYIQSIERAFRFVEKTLGARLKEADPEEIRQLWQEGMKRD